MIYTCEINGDLESLENVLQYFFENLEDIDPSIIHYLLLKILIEFKTVILTAKCIDLIEKIHTTNVKSCEKMSRYWPCSEIYSVVKDFDDYNCGYQTTIHKNFVTYILDYKLRKGIDIANDIEVFCRYNLEHLNYYDFNKDKKARLWDLNFGNNFEFTVTCYKKIFDFFADISKNDDKYKNIKFKIVKILLSTISRLPSKCKKQITFISEYTWFVETVNEIFEKEDRPVKFSLLLAKEFPEIHQKMRYISLNSTVELFKLKEDPEYVLSVIDIYMNEILWNVYNKKCARTFMQKSIWYNEISKSLIDKFTNFLFQKYSSDAFSCLSLVLDKMALENLLYNISVYITMPQDIKLKNKEWRWLYINIIVGLRNSLEKPSIDSILQVYPKKYQPILNDWFTDVLYFLPVEEFKSIINNSEDEPNIRNLKLRLFSTVCTNKIVQCQISYLNTDYESIHEKHKAAVAEFIINPTEDSFQLISECLQLCCIEEDHKTILISINQIPRMFIDKYVTEVIRAYNKTSAFIYTQYKYYILDLIEIENELSEAVFREYTSLLFCGSLIFSGYSEKNSLDFVKYIFENYLNCELNIERRICNILKLCELSHQFKFFLNEDEEVVSLLLKSLILNIASIKNEIRKNIFNGIKELFYKLVPENSDVEFLVIENLCDFNGKIVTLNTATDLILKRLPKLIDLVGKLKLPEIAKIYSKNYDKFLPVESNEFYFTKIGLKYILCKFLINSENELCQEFGAILFGYCDLEAKLLIKPIINLMINHKNPVVVLYGESYNKKY